MTGKKHSFELLSPQNAFPNKKTASTDKI